VRGLYRFYEELALRLAERGYAAVAIDWFGRTAGVAKRDDDFPYMEHVAETRQASVQSDIAAAVAWLRSPEGGSRARIFTVGFCFGGRQSWLAAAGGHGLREPSALRLVRRAQPRARADRGGGPDRCPRAGATGRR
jgi:carboxymethylenebutenolidase